MVDLYLFVPGAHLLLLSYLYDPSHIAISQLARSFYTIMSSGDPSAHTSTPPSASATVAAGSKLEMTIRKACKSLSRIFQPEDDDDEIKENLNHAYYRVHDYVSEAGDSKLKSRLKNESEFKAYVSPGSNGERQLLSLVGSMAKQKVPWIKLFENGILLSSLWGRAH